MNLERESIIKRWKTSKFLFEWVNKMATCRFKLTNPKMQNIVKRWLFGLSLSFQLWIGLPILYTLYKNQRWMFREHWGVVGPFAGRWLDHPPPLFFFSTSLGFCDSLLDCSNPLGCKQFFGVSSPTKLEYYMIRVKSHYFPTREGANLY